MPALTITEYREKMQKPIGDLAIAIWGKDDGTFEEVDDWTIVRDAAKTIKTLKSMVLATGMNKNMLKAVIDEVVP